jgi:hypothetical protein
MLSKMQMLERRYVDPTRPGESHFTRAGFLVRVRQYRADGSPVEFAIFEERARSTSLGSSVSRRSAAESIELNTSGS